MKIDDILANWQKDGQLDRTNLVKAAQDVPVHHAKYIKMLLTARLQYKKLELQYAALKDEKIEFYRDGPTSEKLKLGWEMPAKGLLKSHELTGYMSRDPHIIEMQLKLATALEKMNLLESILQQINSRSFLIGHILEWEKLTNPR